MSARGGWTYGGHSEHLPLPLDKLGVTLSITEWVIRGELRSVAMLDSTL